MKVEYWNVEVIPLVIQSCEYLLSLRIVIHWRKYQMDEAVPLVSYISSSGGQINKKELAIWPLLKRYQIIDMC